MRVEGRLGEAERARLAEKIAEEFRVQLAGVKAACEAKHKMDLAQQRVDLLKVCVCVCVCVQVEDETLCCHLLVCQRSSCVGVVGIDQGHGGKVVHVCQEARM